MAITYCPLAIEPLLAAGVDINEQTRFGPPLLTAARYQWFYTDRARIQGRENAVKILLEKGADPNTRDSEGRNALMVMSMESRPSNLQTEALRAWRVLEVTRGVAVGVHGVVLGGEPVQSTKDFTVYDDQPNAAILLIGEALLQAGCDINATDSSGRTALMYAARYNRITAVRLLLERGADTRAKDKGGLTALDLARQFGDKEIIRLLQSASIQPGAAKKPSSSPAKPGE